MKIIDVQQNSLEWLLARCGVLTASEFDNIVTPEFAQRKGEMPKTYLARKLAEKWIGGPLPSFNSIDMDFGKMREESAIPFYELEFGETVQRVGFITTDDGLVGCSPDGLIGQDGGLEVKCPAIHTHVRYLMEGGLPKEYVAQVHGSLYVTGRDWWRFMSYCPGFPPLVLTIERDEEILAKLIDALADALDELAHRWDKLELLNGGPPKRYVAPSVHTEPTSDQNDVPIP